MATKCECDRCKKIYDPSEGNRVEGIYQRKFEEIRLELDDRKEPE